MPPDSHFIHLDALSIHLLRWPNPGAPPLLLLHATGFLADLWRRLAEPLAAHYDIAALDVRGHGRAATPDAGYDFPSLTDDIVAVLDALGWRDVLAAGHSMGGALALIAASRRPELVRGVFAVEPIVPTRAWRETSGAQLDGDRLADAARNRRPSFSSRAAVAERWRERPPFRSWDSRVFDDYVEYGFEQQPDGSVALRCPPHIEAGVFDAAADFDAEPFLRDVRCPVLLAQGERTTPWFDAMLANAAALLPNASRLTIPGAGHLAPMEVPDLIASQIRAFDDAS